MLITHKDRVRKLVKKDPDLLEMLLEETASKPRRGATPPDFAEMKHKTVVCLSGVNVVLLQKMIRDTENKNKFTKVTKSVILNRMMEYYLKNHTTKPSRKMGEP